jgi:hypothetical protein
VTAEGVAGLLTLELRRRGERKILKCHQDVSEALRRVIPPHEPDPYEPPWFTAGVIGSLAMLTGIDVVTDEDCAPGEWRLVREADDSLVQGGRLSNG